MCGGLKRVFFLQFFVFVSWIGTLKANGIHLSEKIDKVDPFCTPPYSQSLVTSDKRMSGPVQSGKEASSSRV